MKRVPPEDRLSCALRVYVSPRELQAIDQVASINGRSSLIRQAIAQFIQAQSENRSRKDLHKA